MPGSLQSRRTNRQDVRQTQVRPSSRKPPTTASRHSRPSYRLIGQATPVTVPVLQRIPTRFCTRWDEQPAAALGKSLLRLGICRVEDWTGSAVDFVERGYKRFCKAHGAVDANRIWAANLGLIDSPFDRSEIGYYHAQAEMEKPPDCLF